MTNLGIASINVDAMRAVFFLVVAPTGPAFLVGRSGRSAVCRGGGHGEKAVCCGWVGG